MSTSLYLAIGEFRSRMTSAYSTTFSLNYSINFNQSFALSDICIPPPIINFDKYKALHINGHDTGHCSYYYSMNIQTLFFLLENRL